MEKKTVVKIHQELVFILFIHVGQFEEIIGRNRVYQGKLNQSGDSILSGHITRDFYRQTAHIQVHVSL